MALDHADAVASLALVSSWAGPDPYFSNQFAVRRSILLEQGAGAYTRASSLFLFAPSFAAANPGVVEGWIERAGSHPGDPEIMRQRIDMILAHDQRARLSEIAVPTLVMVGDEDICTPPFASRELADSIPRARLEVLPGGHLIYLERPETFAAVVSSFLASV
jgi:aminoacrylate hydrolase